MATEDIIPGAAMELETFDEPRRAAGAALARHTTTQHNPDDGLRDVAELSVSQAVQQLISNIRQGNRDGVALLLESQDSPFKTHKNIINQLDEQLLGPLHYAARSGETAIAQMLLKHKANLNLEGDERVTPIHLAAKHGNLETLEVLATYTESPKELEVRDEYRQTPLHYAVIRGHFHVTQALVKKFGCNPNVADSQLLTPMHVACSHGFAQIAALLLDNNAELSPRDVDDGTPLHAACMEGHAEVVSVLLAKSSDQLALLAEGDGQCNTALHLAVEHNQEDIVHQLLAAGSNPNLATVRGLTPMHLAASNGNVSIVSALLEKRAHPMARDANNMAPLHYAAQQGRVEAVERLLNAKKVRVNCTDSDGYTPLLLASWKGHAEVVSLLLRCHANAVQPEKSGKTALHFAVEDSHKEVMEALLTETQQDQLDLLLKSTDRYDNTVLHLAAINSSPLMTSRLLETSQKVFLLQARNDEERTAAHLAAYHGNTRVLKTLLLADSSLIESEDDKANCPLHLAAIKGHSAVIELLLEMGAPVDPRNDSLWTPLDCAAAKGFFECCEILLDYNAPIDTVDKTQMTPLHLAARENYGRVVKLLLDRGANITLNNSEGLNCLDIAVVSGNLEVCDTVIKHSKWELAMSNRHPETNMTPMKRMIRYLPEAAELVLNRCFWANKKSKNSPEYEVTFTYKYIDEAPSDRLQASAFVEQTPLWMMKQLDRGSLLSHPVVISLLRHKWKRFGASGFYMSVLVYLFFVVFLTAFVLDNSASELLGDHDLSTLSAAAERLVVIFSVIRICTELLQMVQDGRAYFSSFKNWMEWITFSTAIAFLIPLGAEKSEAQYSVGVISVFTAWINLVVLVRQFDVIGIYVVMFASTAKTVLKVLSVFFLFVMGFALSFYVLFQDFYHFHTFGFALMKTFVMMTGEFEYTDYLQTSLLKFSAIPFVMMVIFVILMPIILMNLLIGLAVGDITSIMENARMERRKLWIEYLLPLQSFIVYIKRIFPAWVSFFLPGRGASDNFKDAAYIHVPNKSRLGGFKRLLGDSMPLEAEEVGPLQAAQQENRRLRHNIEQLQAHVRELEQAFEHQGKVLQAIVEARKIQIEVEL